MFEHSEIPFDSQSPVDEELTPKGDPSPGVDEDARVYDLSLKRKDPSTPPELLSLFPNLYCPPNDGCPPSASAYPNQTKIVNGFPESQTDNPCCSRHVSTNMQRIAKPSSGLNHENSFALPSTSCAMPMSAAISSARVLMQTAQQQRCLQPNPPSTPFLLQSLRNNYERMAALNWLNHYSQLTSINNNSANNLRENSMDLK